MHATLRLILNSNQALKIMAKWLDPLYNYLIYTKLKHYIIINNLNNHYCNLNCIAAKPYHSTNLS